MSKFVFRISVAVLLTTMFAIFMMIGKQNSEALANRPQQKTQQSDRAQLAAGMVDTISRRGNRMYDLCSYLSTVAAQVRMESLTPRSTCEGMRVAQNDAIARINGTARNGTDEDFRVMSRRVDQFMIETAPQLRTMEESYATVSRIMREAGR